MDRKTFIEFMNALEQRVIVPAIEASILGKRVWAPIRDGKLYYTPLAELIGTRFYYPRPAVIEYFGMHKRSTGFMEKAQKVQELLTGFDAPLVNFSTVRDIHLRQYAPDLMVDFPVFKAQIVKARFAVDADAVAP